MKTNQKLIPALCLLALTSCGNDKTSPSTPTTRPQQEIQSEGVFKAILRPYNFNLAGWVPNGMVDIKIVGDHVEVKSWLDDSANVVHMQNIHTGTKCPGTEQDANKDGFVDFQETVKYSGDILLPLDEDLNTNIAYGNVYPRGNYTYFQTASLSEMMNSFTQKLSMEGKVIIITGVAANRGLPQSVSTMNNQSREFSIPIACGVIERMPE